MAGGTLRIESNNAPVAVSLTETASGSVTQLYSDSACTATVSQPVTVASNTPTLLYVVNGGTYTLSVQASGVEIAGGYGVTRQVVFDHGEFLGLRYSPLREGLSSSGSYAPLFQTMTGAAAPDGFAYQPTTFAGVVDPIWKIGYNAGGQTSGEPQWHIGIEGNYRTPINDAGIWFQDGAAHNTNEMYAEYFSPSGAINFRPFYIGVLRDDNVTKAACVYFDVGTSGFPKSQFQIKAGASTMLTVTAGGVDVSTGIPLRVGGVSVLTAAAPIAPFGNVVAPPGFGIAQVASGGTMSALSGRGVRVIVPKNGTLHDIAAYVAASSGNINIAVYDTGDQTAGSGTRTRLYQSGSIACPAAGSWQVLADPNITVTAGQQLDLVITADNATASFARYAMNGGGGGPASTQLPGSLNAVPGNAAPKMCFTYPTLGAIGTYPTTVIEAGVAQQDNPMLLIGRVA